MKKKTKEDRVIELLGALCEKLDKLLTELQRLGNHVGVPHVPPPPKAPNPWPTMVMYGCTPPYGTGKPWDGYWYTTISGSTDPTPPQDKR